MLLGNITESIANITTTDVPENGSEDVTEEIVPFKRLRFVFVPLFVIAVVVIMSGLVYLMIRKKRLDQLRHHLVPLYNFDPAERDDWESELLEDTVDQRIQKKDYKSMDSPNATS